MSEPEPTRKPKPGDPDYTENAPLPASQQFVCGANILSRYERLRPIVVKIYDVLKGKR